MKKLRKEWPPGFMSLLSIHGFIGLSNGDYLPVLKAAARELPGILLLLPRVLSVISLKNALSSRGAVAVPKNLPRPFFTLQAVAVDARFRGTGIGAMLLDEVRRAAGENPGIAGIYLITLTEKNKRLYEKRGYKTIEKRRLKELNLYHMFSKTA